MTADGVEAVEEGGAAAVAAVSEWSPTMTPAQAQEFARDSAYKETFYHFTSSEGATGIRAEGFRVSDGVYGRGIYLTSDSEGGGIGRSFTTERLEVITNVRNPLEVNGMSALNRWMKEAGLDDLEVDEALAGSGHDALRLRFANKPDYLLIFDKRRAVVMR